MRWEMDEGKGKPKRVTRRDVIAGENPWKGRSDIFEVLSRGSAPPGTQHGKRTEFNHSLQGLRQDLFRGIQ